MQIVRCGIAAPPFRLSSQFSEGCGCDRGRRCGSEPVRGASRRGRRSADGQRQAGSALRHSWRFGDVAGPAGRRLRPGRCAGRGQENSRRRAEPASGRRGGDRRNRPHRHARVYRYASSPVRDGAAQLSRRRDPDQRRLGHGGRDHNLLRVHSAHVRPGLPAAGCVHQRAVRGVEPARRRRHDRARRLANPPHAPALRRRHPGPVRYWASRGLRLFRGRGDQRPQLRISAGRLPHQSSNTSPRPTSSSR